MSLKVLNDSLVHVCSDGIRDHLFPLFFSLINYLLISENWVKCFIYILNIFHNLFDLHEFNILV